MKLRGLAASLTVLAAITVGAGGCSEANAMTFDSIAGLVMAVLLLAYLVYALLRPEKF